MSLKFRSISLFFFAFATALNAQAKDSVSVIAYQVELENVQQTIEVLGELKAVDSVVLTPNVSEIVSKIHFDDGQEVTQGQLLIEFNNRQELAELREKQISAAEAKKQYYRLKKLQGRATVSQSQIDEQYRDWQVLEAEINTLKTRIADLRIEAPFAGQLGLRQFSIGAFVEQGQPLVSLDNIQQMQLDLMVADKYLTEIELGQTINIKSEAYPDNQFTAQITAISPQLDTASRMLKIRAKLENEAKLLKTNMLVSAFITLPVKQKLTIPNKSILMLGDHNFVYRIKNKGYPYSVIDF